MWENEEMYKELQKEISEEGSEVRMRELENLNGKGELAIKWLWNKGLVINIAQ